MCTKTGTSAAMRPWCSSRIRIVFVRIRRSFQCIRRSGVRVCTSCLGVITAMPHQRLPRGQKQGLQQLCDLGIQVVFEWYSSVFGSLCSVFWFFAIANTVCLLTFWPTGNPSKYSYYNYKRGKRVLKWGPRASCQAEGGHS